MGWVKYLRSDSFRARAAACRWGGIRCERRPPSFKALGYSPSPNAAKPVTVRQQPIGSPEAIT